MDTFKNNEDIQNYISKIGATLVYQASSAYQDIYVMDQSRFGIMRGKFRALQFTSDAIQGIINMEHPGSLVTAYSRITVDLIEHYAADFKKGFIIGHGIGTVSSYYSHKYLLTAEIDPLVVEVSKKYFGHTGNNVVVGDGLTLLKTQDAQSQDIIFLDAYSSNEIPVHLTTKEFFSLTNKKLTTKGILIVNYVGKLRNDHSLDTLYATISEIYPYVKLFATYPNVSLKQNIFFVASRHFLEDYSPQEATLSRILVDRGNSN